MDLLDSNDLSENILLIDNQTDKWYFMLCPRMGSLCHVCVKLVELPSVIKYKEWTDKKGDDGVLIDN